MKRIHQVELERISPLSPVPGLQRGAKRVHQITRWCAENRCDTLRSAMLLLRELKKLYCATAHKSSHSEPFARRIRAILLSSCQKTSLPSKNWNNLVMFRSCSGSANLKMTAHGRLSNSIEYRNF